MSVKTRVERLEQRNPEPGGPPIIVIVSDDGTYHANGAIMTQAEFEARWPKADMPQLRGFDNVVVTIGGISLADDI